MFDLDQAIADWHRRMAAGGIKHPEVLDELESHLRDQIDAFLKSGLGAQESFGAAVQSFGKAGSLKRELDKSGAKRAPALQTATLKTTALLCVLLLAVVGLTGFGTGMPWGEKLIGGVAVVLLFTFVWQYGVRAFGTSPGNYPIYPLAPDASHSFQVARQEAISFHHDYVGTEHLLLGLLQSEYGVVSQVLQKLGVGRKAIRIQVESLVEIGLHSITSSKLPCTPRVMRALELAATEAKVMQHNQVSPEHLFLGLLLEGSGVAALALKNIGVDFEQTRDEILKARSDQHNG